jgi:hypothetical protein
MSYQIEVVVVPDGDERGVYVSPDEYKLDREAFASDRAYHEALGGRLAVINFALHEARLPYHVGPLSKEAWERLIGLVVCGLAERKFL